MSDAGFFGMWTVSGLFAVCVFLALILGEIKDMRR